MATTTDLDAGAVLAAARRFRSDSDAAEVGVLLQAVEWCRLHEVEEAWDAATWRETGLPLAGEGAPLVAEFALADFGAALGISTDSARVYLAQALELAHRLPLTFARAVAGELQVWRARRIAEFTITLTPDAASYVDQQIAPFAPTIGPAATERLVEEAILRFMPETAIERAERAAEGRHVTISHDHRTGTGVSSLYGTLDTADALDLEHALRDGAEALRAAGSEDSLDVRRSVALGELARGQRQLGIEKPRDVTLYVHLYPDAETTGLARVENGGNQVITPETLTRWIGTGAAKVVIKPVIDLNKPISTSTYAVPEKIREHLVLRNPTCVFPHCTRPARSADIDHIHPYDPDGPDDQTSTGNLAPLCRYHHRLKTLSRWTYTMVEPGVFLWQSPHGYSYLRDRHGTRDLTPRPVEPPGG